MKTLRYTITVQNIGTENATGVNIVDQVPGQYRLTSPDSTMLNGVVVPDASGDVPRRSSMASMSTRRVT